MSEQLEVLKLVTRRLESADIAYILTGSIASGHYGQPRMTRDIDIVAVLHPLHADRLERLLRDVFVCDRDTMRDAIVARRMFSVIHRAAVQKIDVIVRTDADYELEKFERRRRVSIDGQEMWLISPEDLVLSKLVWAKGSRSELQARDVSSIMALQPDLDWPYLNRWAVRLTVAARLAELRT